MIMSSIDNVKPPRPCTEYNLFFQLERAYILQNILQNKPNLDATEIFHPSQPTYVGRPALPRRYASLILPYDWHLPGKEQRRKRKHRKSHGAISFHDLSARVVNAWKVVDDEVKAYCSQVCAIGMLRYKAAVKEWKLKGGEQQKQNTTAQKNRRQVMAKMLSLSESVAKSEVIKSSNSSTTIKGRKTLSKQNDIKKPFQNDFIQDMVQDEMMPIPSPVSSQAVFGYNPRRKLHAPEKPVEEVNFEPIEQHEVLPIPAPVVCESVTIEELNRAFEHDILLGGELVDLGDDNILGMWGVAKEQEPVILQPALATFSTADVMNTRTLRNPSIISNEPVDMEDNEIMNMWSQEQRNNSPSIPSIVSSNLTTIHDNQIKEDDDRHQQYRVTLNASDGGTQKVQEIEKMRLMLEQQMQEIEMVKRRTVVASSA